MTDASKVMASGGGVRLLVICIVSVLAASSISCATYSTARFQDPGGDYSLSSYLATLSIPHKVITDSTVELVNTPQVRDALQRYLHIALTRYEVISNNLANINTPAPYERQKVFLEADGSVKSVPRTGATRFLVFKPAHPAEPEYGRAYPDGVFVPDPDSYVPDGYVAVAEIDPDVEMTDIFDAEKQFSLASELLSRFDPASILPSWPQSHENQCIPNAYSFSSQPRCPIFPSAPDTRHAIAK